MKSKKLVYIHFNIHDDIYERAVKYSNIEEGIISNHNSLCGLIEGFNQNNFIVKVDLRTSFLFHSRFWRSSLFSKYVRKIYFKIFKKIDIIFYNKFILQKRVLKYNPNIYITELNDFVLKRSLKIFSYNKIKTIQWFGIFPSMVNSNSNILLNVPYFDLVISLGNILPFFKVKPKLFLELTPAFNPNFFFKDKNITGYKFDVLFVGGLSKKHSNRWETLELIFNNFKNIGIYGYGIDEVPDIYQFKKCFKGMIFNEDLRVIINKSKISINLFLNGFDNLTSGINQRTIEINACGAFQLSKYSPNIKKVFKIGEEIEVFENNKELLDKIKFYLKNSKIREKIALNGQKRISKFTYKNKVRQIIKFIN